VPIVSFLCVCFLFLSAYLSLFPSTVHLFRSVCFWYTVTLCCCFLFICLCQCIVVLLFYGPVCITTDNPVTRRLQPQTFPQCFCNAVAGNLTLTSYASLCNSICGLIALYIIFILLLNIRTEAHHNIHYLKRNV